MLDVLCFMLKIVVLLFFPLSQVLNLGARISPLNRDNMMRYIYEDAGILICESDEDSSETEDINCNAYNNCVSLVARKIESRSKPGLVVIRTKSDASRLNGICQAKSGYFTSERPEVSSFVTWKGFPIKYRTINKQL